MPVLHQSESEVGMLAGLREALDALERDKAAIQSELDATATGLILPVEITAYIFFIYLPTIEGLEELREDKMGQTALFHTIQMPCACRLFEVLSCMEGDRTASLWAIRLSLCLTDEIFFESEFTFEEVRIPVDKYLSLLVFDLRIVDIFPRGTYPPK
jgi:hypothetical protein